MLGSCDEKVTLTPDSINRELWDELNSIPEYSTFVSILKTTGLDSLFLKNEDYTIFVPNNTAFESYDYANDPFLHSVMQYHFINFPLVINTVEERNFLTLSGKYATIRNSNNSYNYSGVEVVKESPLLEDGRYYEISNVALPASTIAEHLKVFSPSLYVYIQSQDSTYLDMNKSEYIGNNPETGEPIYDEVYTTINTFYEHIFNIEKTTRDDFGTFIMFDEEQYQNAQKQMAEELNIDDIPLEWLDDVFFPDYVSSAVFYGMVDFEEMSGEQKLRNTQGEYVLFDTDVVDKDSKVTCTNGLTYMSETFEFDLDKYVKDIEILPEDIVIQNGLQTFWNDNVTSSHNDIKPILGSDVLVLNLAKIDASQDYWFEITIPYIFPAEGYRLEVNANVLTSCRVSMYANGVLLTNENTDMFIYPDNTAEVFDMKYLQGTLYSVNYAQSKAKFTKKDNYNRFDYWVKDAQGKSLVNDYGALRLRIAYRGASKNYSSNDGFNFKSIKLIREN